MFEKDSGGEWDGGEVNKTGEYGFAFKLEEAMNLTALGRHAVGHWDYGLGLKDMVDVTLWDTAAGSLVRRVNVGPGISTADPLSDNKWWYTYLDPKIELTAQKEYRITQTCHENMKDSWFDDFATEIGILNEIGSICMKPQHGVHSTSPLAFPDQDDDDRLRVGMLNAKFD